MELHGALEALLSGDDLSVIIPQKTHFSDANYVEDGPYPFVCGTCRHITLGASYDPATATDNAQDPSEWGDFCQKVHGPYDHGRVAAEDSCRFWKHKEAYLARIPIAHEYSGTHVGGQGEAGQEAESTGPSTGVDEAPDVQESDQ